MIPLARVYRGSPRNLARLARLLQSGEIVAVPTETVYGLAADALNEKACKKVFRAKGRPANDPLIVHIHAFRELVQIAEPNEAALRLGRKFWPGPLTLVLPKTRAVSDVVTAGRPSVAVRMPSHPLLRKLLRLAGRPLAAPSANPFGYISPTTAEHVRRQLGRRIGHILDGGPCRIGLESTIVDLRDPRKPRLLRPGAITRSEIRRALGRPVALAHAAPAASKGQIAPGQLARHYQPHTPVVLHRRLSAASPRQAPREAWLFLHPSAGIRGKNVFCLGEKGDLRAAARRLFATLRQIDELGFERIHVELAQGSGIAEAINDRLRRAAGPTASRRGSLKP